mmetsp:Transcript_29663/g.99877  ORF Transcript_29663/g.99877 Transcript_29663/m.99877 type:complete len:219 (-) Transcript_29663:465-1121(-)
MKVEMKKNALTNCPRATGAMEVTRSFKKLRYSGAAQHFPIVSASGQGRQGSEWDASKVSSEGKGPCSKKSGASAARNVSDLEMINTANNAPRQSRHARFAPKAADAAAVDSRLQASEGSRKTSERASTASATMPKPAPRSCCTPTPRVMEKASKAPPRAAARDNDAPAATPLTSTKRKIVRCVISQTPTADKAKDKLTVADTAKAMARPRICVFKLKV